LTFNRLHGVKSQKTEVFIATAVSNQMLHGLRVFGSRVLRGMFGSKKDPSDRRMKMIT
jgi:hypothetical protein